VSDLQQRPGTARDLSRTEALVQTVREHERFMWSPYATTEGRRASAKNFDAALTTLAQRIETLERENRLLTEEIRVREESQIPMVPRGAQARIETLEEERDDLRAELTEWQTSIATEALQAKLTEAEAALTWVEEMTAGRAGVSGIADYVRAALRSLRGET
jgi:septation ring formation regulator EzrA